MNIFKTFKGIVAPLDRSNVDTDAIIPKEYLKSIKRTGFGKNLFDAWRYINNHTENENDSRKINTSFILNRFPYNKAEILLARENFGCGSSREHAVWALIDFGFKVVIAPSFGEIFYSNSFKNGFLPIRLKNEEIDKLFDMTNSIEEYRLAVNLKEQYVEIDDNKKFFFDIDDSLKNRLLEGVDDIAITLKRSCAIKDYEKRRKAITPWLFKGI